MQSVGLDDQISFGNQWQIDKRLMTLWNQLRGSAGSSTVSEYQDHRHPERKADMPPLSPFSPRGNRSWDALLYCCECESSGSSDCSTECQIGTPESGRFAKFVIRQIHHMLEFDVWPMNSSINTVSFPFVAMLINFSPIKQLLPPSVKFTTQPAPKSAASEPPHSICLPSPFSRARRVASPSRAPPPSLTSSPATMSSSE